MTIGIQEKLGHDTEKKTWICERAVSKLSF